MTTLVQIVKTLVVLSALSLAGAAVSWVARKIGYETGALKTENEGEDTVGGVGGGLCLGDATGGGYSTLRTLPGRR